MFRESLDDVLYPPNKDNFGLQLHQFIKNKANSPSKAGAHMKKKIPQDKVAHLQNLLAWSCNSTSTK